MRDRQAQPVFSVRPPPAVLPQLPSGTSTQNGRGNAWIYVPEGNCGKTAGGGLTEKTG